MNGFMVQKRQRRFATRAVALLTSGGWPRTACNISAITAWENAEGGNWANSARFNPLDTTEPEPGSYPMNRVGVQAYTSWAEGFRATFTTLANGNYGGILATLAAGYRAQAVAAAVADSPWERPRSGRAPRRLAARRARPA